VEEVDMKLLIHSVATVAAIGMLSACGDFTGDRDDDRGDDEIARGPDDTAPSPSSAPSTSPSSSPAPTSSPSPAPTTSPAPSSREDRITSPGDQISTVGAVVTVQIQLTRTDDDDRYVFAATGLPPGLRIDEGSGLIFGLPTAAGSYDVTVKATEVGEPDDVSSVAFKWTVQ
jgi:hypothetical protein